MAIDALRSYLQLASGLSDVTKERARSAAQALASANPLESGASAVSSLADDLVAVSRTNRDLLVGLIRSEVDRAVHRLGVVTDDELDSLARRVAKLERADDDDDGQAGPTTKRVAKKVAAKKVPATKTPAKAAAKKTPAKKVPVPASQASAAPQASPAQSPAPTAPPSPPPTMVSTAPSPPESTAADEVGL